MPYSKKHARAIHKNWWIFRLYGIQQSLKNLAEDAGIPLTDLERRRIVKIEKSLETLTLKLKRRRKVR